jgi:flagellar capping protein FliD
MATPVGTVNGVASGIQWQGMVDQIIALESHRTVDPLTTRQTALQSAAAAWTEFQLVVGKFRDAAQAVRDATSFSTLTGGASKSPTSSLDLVSVAADTRRVRGATASRSSNSRRPRSSAALSNPRPRPRWASAARLR